MNEAEWQAGSVRHKIKGQPNVAVFWFSAFQQQFFFPNVSFTENDNAFFFTAISLSVLLLTKKTNITLSDD